MKKLFFMMATVAAVTMFASCNELGISPIKLDLSGNIVDTWARYRIWVDSTAAGGPVTDTYTPTGQPDIFIFSLARIQVTKFPYADTAFFDSQMVYTALKASASVPAPTYGYDPKSGIIIMDRTPARVARIGAEDMTIEFWTGGVNIDATGVATPNITGPNVLNRWYFKRNVNFSTL